jgi:hypothetical protein
LLAEGHDVINPADLDRAAGFDPIRLPADHDWHDINSIGFSIREAVHRDVEAIKVCDAIYMLQGWERSKGAKAEKALAEWLGCKVMYERRPRSVVGLAGYINSGKNQAASMIPGAVVFEWSDRIYAGLSAMLGVPVSVLKRRDVKENGITVAGVHIDVRRALQTLGTEWGRELINEQLWVSLTLEATKDLPVVALPGTRFQNEAEAVWADGGEVWWVDRPGLVPGTHKSDRLIRPDDCDRIIKNHLGLDYLHAQVVAAWNAYQAMKV